MALVERPDVVQSVLTGNLREVARIKLRGLWAGPVTRPTSRAQVTPLADVCIHPSGWLVTSRADPAANWVAGHRLLDHDRDSVID